MQCPCAILASVGTDCTGLTAVETFHIDGGVLGENGRIAGCRQRGFVIPCPQIPSLADVLDNWRKNNWPWAVIGLTIFPPHLHHHDSAEANCSTPAWILANLCAPPLCILTDATVCSPCDTKCLRTWEDTQLWAVCYIYVPKDWPGCRYLQCTAGTVANKFFDLGIC